MHGLGGGRVWQAEFGRVQQQAWAGRKRLGVGIQVVAQNGVAQCQKVHPQLVGAACDGLQQQPRTALHRAAAQHLPAGDAGLAGGVAHLAAGRLGQSTINCKSMVCQPSASVGGVWASATGLPHTTAW